jgi:hypothetical protein
LTVGDHGLAAASAGLAEAGARRNPGVASLSGLALHTRGIVENDPGPARRGRHRAARRPRPSLYAGALGDHGTALLAAGDADAAVERIDAARTVYERLGATLPGTTLETALRRAGVRSGHRNGGRSGRSRAGTR